MNSAGGAFCAKARADTPVESGGPRALTWGHCYASYNLSYLIKRFTLQEVSTSEAPVLCLSCLLCALAEA
jgi:hypothetical protein